MRSIGRDDQCPHMKQWMASLWRATVVNPISLINSKTIPQFRIRNAWHQWQNTGRIVTNQYFLGSFGRPFDRVPVQFLTSDFLHGTLQTLRKKHRKIRDYDLECSFPITFRNELRTFDNNYDPLDNLHHTSTNQPCNVLNEWHWFVLCDLHILACHVVVAMEWQTLIG